MYKILFLFFVLFALVAFSVAIKGGKNGVHVSGPAMAGSPILVLTH